MIQITPPSPSDSDDVVISASATVPCIRDSGIVRSGFTFTGHIDYGICFTTPPGSSQFPFAVGKLPPGNYTVVVHEGRTNIQQGTFSVSAKAALASPIPTVEPVSLLLVLTLIMLTTIRHFRRR